MKFNDIINQQINTNLNLNAHLNDAMYEICMLTYLPNEALFETVKEYIYNPETEIDENKMSKLIISDFSKLREMTNKFSADEPQNAEGLFDEYLNFLQDPLKPVTSMLDTQNINLDINYKLSIVKQIECLKKSKAILNPDDFSLLIAFYCNNSIISGNYFYINEKDMGLNDFFSTCDEKDNIYCIYKGICTQDYTWFEYIYLNNKKNILANLYLFIRNLKNLMYLYIKDIPQPEDLEAKTWEYYTNLPYKWREFAIQQVDKNAKLSNIKSDYSLFPHINCVSGKDVIVNIICEDFDEITKILDINVEESNANCICEAAFEKCNKKIQGYLVEICELLCSLWSLVINKSAEEAKAFEVLDFPGNTSSLLERISFLNLSVSLHDSIDKTYIIGRYENYMKKKEIERLNQEKLEMMEHYTHSWKHICYPSLVKDVAEVLLKKQDDESITMANKLFKAYNSEQVLKHGIQLLQYSISNDSEEVRNNFEDGFYYITEQGNFFTRIKDILDSSLDMVVFRILMEDADDSSRIKNCRARIKNIEALRESYTKNFLKNSDCKISIWEWVKTNKMFDIAANISDEWNEVKIKKNKFAEAQLSEIIVEILTNIFLHGCNKAEINFCHTDISMDITAKNLYDAESEGNVGSGKGLSSMKNVVDKINIGSNIKESVSSSKNGDEYTICVKLDKDIIYIV